MRKKQHSLAVYLILSFFLVVATTALQLRPRLPRAHSRGWGQEPEPTPMLGRFEIPELPENPTQVDIGENLYYYRCMPCHGDHGQGLTDEFREAWVDDHQNCWARGCHTGQSIEEGFFIPKYIPPVIASQLILHFPTAQILYDYLSVEHPPQNPGVLEDDEYWALTAFLWSENGQLPEGVELAPERDDPTNPEMSAQLESEVEPDNAAHFEPATENPAKLNLVSIGIILLAAAFFVLVVLLARNRILAKRIKNLSEK